MMYQRCLQHNSCRAQAGKARSWSCGTLGECCIEGLSTGKLLARNIYINAQRNVYSYMYGKPGQEKCLTSGSITSELVVLKYRDGAERVSNFAQARGNGSHATLHVSV